MPIEENFLYDKEEYLQTIENKTSRAMAASIFNQCVPYEEKYGLPICRMNIDMLQDIFSHCFGEKIRSVSDARLAIERLLMWQSEKYGIEFNENIKQVDLDPIHKVRKSMVASPYHLARVMDDIFHPINLKTQHNAYRSMLWLVFMGFTFNEAIEITFDEVDFDNMIVTHGGKRVEICREAFDVMKLTKKATEFVVDISRKTKKPRIIEDGLFLCGIRKSKMLGSTASTMLAITQAGKDSNITIKSVESSGIFYRAFELERVTHRINFVEIAMLDKTLKYDPDDPAKLRRQIRETEKRYKHDYEVWKRAFY